MAKNPRDGLLIYHLTSLDNLDNIFNSGLLSRSKVIEFKDVADQEIINWRKEKGLQNLIPFHFFIGTPFAGIVQRNFPGDKFVYITLKREYARERKFKILPKHPISLNDFEIFEYDEGIIRVDWENMALRDYSDIVCKATCMAECLTDITIPANEFHSIIVPNEEIKKFVLQLKSKYLGVNSSLFVNIMNVFVT